MRIGDRIGAAARLLSDQLGSRVRLNEPLAPMTTYRVGGNASIFVDVAGVDDLRAVREVAAHHDLPVLVVGRGSNMLVADTGFAGIAVSVATLASHIALEVPNAPDGVVAAGGAVALPVLARRTAAAGLTGFEWAVGVPGSVGGAVRMNAGGHGSDMAACLVDVDVFDVGARHGPNEGGHDLVTLGVDDLGLRFRASSLAPGHIIIEARVQLAHGDKGRSEATLSEIVQWRREHQPGGQNCGSVFVNPVPGEVAAGGLIDELGLRGFTIGTAFVSDKHANFIQATPGGSAADVRSVIETVRARVAEATGYQLRSEVRLVGFADTDPLAFDDAVVGS